MANAILAKVGVEGSNPFARSRFFNHLYFAASSRSSGRYGIRWKETSFDAAPEGMKCPSDEVVCLRTLA